MDFHTSWVAFVHWFDKDTLNVLSSIGSFGAALCAAVAAALARQQHLDAQTGAPTVEIPNSLPRVQVDFENPDPWDGMGDYRLTIRNIGTGALLNSHVECAAMSPAGKVIAELPSVELLTVGSRSFAVRPDGRAISRLLGGVEHGFVPIHSRAIGEKFELAPGTAYEYRVPREIYAWCLAHAVMTTPSRPAQSPSEILELTIHYTTAGKRHRRRCFQVALTPIDLGGTPGPAPRALGVNFELKLRSMA